MINIFVMSAANTEARVALRQYVTNFWTRGSANRGWRVTHLTLGRTATESDRLDFLVTSRGNAHVLARGEPYVLTDDDMLPHSFEMVEEGLEWMRGGNHQFKMMAAQPDPHDVGVWNPKDYVPLQDDDYIEHYACGGMRFVMGDAGDYLVGTPHRDYDYHWCKAIREAGGRVGYFRELRAFHAGWFSTTLWTEGKMKAEGDVGSPPAN